MFQIFKNFLFQGSTVPENSKVVIHWSNDFKRKNNAGMAYVALGRTEQLKDIFIRGQVDPEGIHASAVALEETDRLQRIFDERIETLNEQKKNCWKISYLNVRSLKGKQLDVERDNFIMAADVFALGETWLEQCESVNFLGYEANFASHGRGKGVSTFSKMDSVQLNCVSSETFSAIHMRTEKFDIVFVYKLDFFPLKL